MPQGSTSPAAETDRTRSAACLYDRAYRRSGGGTVITAVLVIRLRT
ncbi:hypothetical protein SUDANB105_07627 [Streptomyces sp. enrichment culture]